MGVAEGMTLGLGVGTGYLPLVSSAAPRIMIHAMSTPEAPTTRTIANTHGKALLRVSPRRSLELTGGRAY
jgi:hypothetical protein